MKIEWWFRPLNPRWLCSVRYAVKTWDFSIRAESLAETGKGRVWPGQHTKVLYVHLCMLPWCMWIYESTHTWADLPVYIQLRPVFSREKRGRPENPRNWQMWTRTADLNIGNAASCYTSLSRAEYTVCVLFLPSKETKKKQQECKKVWFKLVRLLRRDLHNLFEGNGEARRELIRENVTVDSHFSSNWLDMKLSKWASRTHEKSLQMMRKKDKRAWKKGKKGRLDTIVTPILIS